MRNVFRKQFVFAPEKLMGKKFASWPAEKVSGNILKWHPSTDCACASYNARRILLIGLALHCEEPEWSEQDIAQNLSESVSENALLDRLDKLCGTYVVIEENHGSIRFFNDVSSSGKIFYTVRDSGTVLGSDPKIISRLVKLKKDDSAEATAFYSSNFFKESKYKQWIGDLTWYQNVFQVLPNHGYDLIKKDVFRYFPRTERKELPVEEIIRESARLLKNISTAIFHRDDAFISLTAGWDSRVIMASTRDFSEKATYYTFEYPGSSVNEKDVGVAEKICSDLKLRHVKVRPTTSLPAKYADAIINSFELRNDGRFHGFLKMFNNQLTNKYAVTGSISEIAKNYFERLPIDSGAALTSVANYPKQPYCVNYFQRWIDESKPVIEGYGYTPQDFAHWEQDIANFAGAGILNSSFVANRISPFNCRKLIDLILCANINYRDGYNNVVYRGIISTLWPELLNYPVNPTVKVQLINWAKRLRIYSAYRRIRQKVV